MPFTFFSGIPKIKYQVWMRFSFAFSHTFSGTGGDPFGAATKMSPWEDGTNSLAMAKRRSKLNGYGKFLNLFLCSWNSTQRYYMNGSRSFMPKLRHAMELQKCTSFLLIRLIRERL